MRARREQRVLSELKTPHGKVALALPAAPHKEPQHGRPLMLRGDQRPQEAVFSNVAPPPTCRTAGSPSLDAARASVAFIPNEEQLGSMTIAVSICSNQACGGEYPG